MLIKVSEQRKQEGHNMSSLPELPSDLFTVALADLRKVATNPAYEIDMGTWHENCVEWDADDEDAVGVCHVCFAGAVMAGTLGTDITSEIAPSHFEEYDQIRLLALDQLCHGYVMDALVWMKHSDVDHIEANEAAYNALDFETDGYHADPKAWYVQIEALIVKLKALEL